jgi:esterase/lipase superfamily enzyme
VLVAPDIDVDVAPAKIYKVFSDPDLPFGKARALHVVLEPSPDFKVTIYVSPDDRALAASSWLSGSIARVGRVDPSKLSREEVEQIRLSGLFDVVQVRGTTDFFGHSYFVSNPRVSADIIAMLRYGLKPNDPGRPLQELNRPFWRVHTGGDANSRE